MAPQSNVPLPALVAVVVTALASSFWLGIVSERLSRRRRNRDEPQRDNGLAEVSEPTARQGDAVDKANDTITATATKKAKTTPDVISKKTKKDDNSKKVEEKQKEGTKSPSEYNLIPIGHVSSVYRLCVGTPRQGLLAPNSRGKIILNPSLLTADSISGLDGFSHMWVVFIFHLNNNSKIVKRSRDAKAQGLSRQFPSKIAPPALGGKKVGLFSTRTPHRPNPIGLSLCKIDSITRGKTPSQPFCVNVSGLDLVDGTPVLDIKPFVPHYDTVLSADDVDINGAVITNIPEGVRVPHWVGSGLEKRRMVEFTDKATDQLRSICNDDGTCEELLEFYGPNSNGRDGSTSESYEALCSCIREVLAVDVRSKWQTGKARKGKSRAERSKRMKNGDKDDEDNNGEEKIVEQRLCTQQLDNLLISFRVMPPPLSTSDAKNNDNGTDTASMGSGAKDQVIVEAVEYRPVPKD